ncbi:hypothetical protein [Citrobacter rodentium]|uniref:hypothetical protein n=1 Tax=Citrobacter rodentium TaxID=67825 RepID=UPI001E42F854|nr:hypothetical protein [Citrobacter rodentium]
MDDITACSSLVMVTLCAPVLTYSASPVPDIFPLLVIEEIIVLFIVTAASSEEDEIVTSLLMVKLLSSAKVWGVEVDSLIIVSA